MNMELVTEHYAHYVQLLTCVLCHISVLISIDLFIIVHHCMLSTRETCIIDDYWPKVGKLLYTA